MLAIARRPTWRVQARFYSKQVHDHFNNPRNVGSLNKNDLNVGTAIVGKASCGDVIKLQVKVENDVIKDVKFKTFGCGSAIASSSLATEYIKGMKLDEALGVKNTTIAHDLALPPVKFHCSLLAEDAVRGAIENYNSKQPAADSSRQGVGGGCCGGVSSS
eukprot:GHVU01157784.1.p1 GENE.GHVU01157784.1~~GHVU01157784.1.p1  ORF type:complete len:160 (-),score=37.06 GHVU01157784.1:46-525(-)